MVGRLKPYLPAGSISSTHGLKGEVKVYPFLDDPGRFSLFSKVFLEKGGRRIEAEIEKARYFKNMVILKFKGIDDIESVMPYRGYEIMVTREEAAELKEGQYFEADLIGMKVFDEEGAELGELKNVIHTGANDVYTVSLTDGGEVLIPAIKDCIKQVDVEAGEMKVHLLPGL